MNNFIKNHLEILQNNHFTHPEIELRALFNKTSKSGKELILSNFETKQINISIFKKAFKRRLNKEPVAKIFNEKEFWKSKFFVNSDVLDPRPETELIIEAVKKYFPNKDAKYNIADLGTGSGCLAISLSLEYLRSKITATDISKNALKIAKKNSIDLDVYNHINFICCNWINFNDYYDIIVSNPPYLSLSEYNNSETSLRNFEPRIALIGGKDGLSSYTEIAPKIAKVSSKKTISFIEIGQGQRADCVEIFNKFGFECIDILADYQSIERILILRKKK